LEQMSTSVAPLACVNLSKNKIVGWTPSSVRNRRTDEGVHPTNHDVVLGASKGSARLRRTAEQLVEERVVGGGVEGESRVDLSGDVVEDVRAGVTKDGVNFNTGP